MPSFVGSQIHVNRPLGNLATAYTNEELIGLMLAPEIRVEKSADKFFKRNKANAFALVDQPKIGNLEVPPEIDQGVTLADFACEDYGYMARVSQRDQTNADAPLNLMQDAALDLAAQLRLAQEQRIADLLQATGSYASANVTTLSGSDRWDSAGFGDPLGVIDDLCSKIFPAPNTKLIAWMGNEVWLKLKRHPQILGLVNGGATVAEAARISKMKMAELLEVDEVVVGKAWKVATNPSAAVATTRVWGKNFGIARVASGATTRTLHLASSFVFGSVNVMTWFDEAPGLLGAYRVKSTHSTDELIVADDAGCLIATPIS